MEVSEKKNGNNGWFRVIILIAIGIIIAIGGALRVDAAAYENMLWKEDYKYYSGGVSGTMTYNRIREFTYSTNSPEKLNHFVYSSTNGSNNFVLWSYEKIDVYTSYVEYYQRANGTTYDRTENNDEYTGGAYNAEIILSNGTKVYMYQQGGAGENRENNNEIFKSDYYTDYYDIKQSDSKQALKYILDNQLEPDVEYSEIPDLDDMELDYDMYLTGFCGDESIDIEWTGIETDLYKLHAIYIYVSLGYSVNADQVVGVVTYEDNASFFDYGIHVPWEDVQISDSELFLRYVRVTPYVYDNGKFVRGNSSYINFTSDGNVESVKTPIKIDNSSLTTNIKGGVYDDDIPALSNIERINNGYTNVFESFSQSVTFNWSDYYESDEYFIQCRTTFRYKLNADKIWETVTVDTSVPNGRYSTKVDSQTFTYYFGDYVNLFYQQDDSIWTDDDLNKQGNIQPITDSIRIVHIDENGAVSYGPWTTFTLKNGIWETGSITGSYISGELEEDNTSINIPNEEKQNGSFLDNFDFTNVSGVWDMFVGMLKNLVSFLGSFPEIFSSIFSFLPYEIRSMIYISIICICVLGLGKAVIR